MKRAILYICLILLAALLAYRFIQKRSVRAAMTIQQIQSVDGVPVETAQAGCARFTMTRRYSGTVAGRIESEVTPLTAEYISKVLVEEGARVKVGDPICELSRDSPTASFAQAKLALENAERDFSRMEALFRQGAVSRQALDGVTLARDLARERYETSERLLTITSPIAGVVADLRAEKGKFVSPGFLLAKIVSEDQLRVKFEIPSYDKDLTRIGAEAVVTSMGVNARGRLERLALSADRDSRDFQAWVALTSKPDLAAFSPGLSVTIALNVVDFEDAIVVPSDALIRSGDHWKLYVVVQDKAEERAVELGGTDHGNAWIASGLEVGETVVVNGGNNLTNGSRLRIISKS